MLGKNKKCKSYKKRKRTIFFILFILIIIYFIRPTFTSNINGTNSVNKIVNLTINNAKQSLLIRGTNIENPILLLLHGGPGFSQISFAKKYQEKLEKEFIVVNWDQRGSGKSYSFSMDENTITKDQILTDAKEVIKYLCKTYQKEKIIVVGHSWGSELGMNILMDDSSNIAAYIGVGQVVSQLEGTRISYEHALELARINKNNNEIKTLEDMGTPPYEKEDVIDNTLYRQKIIKKYSPKGIDVNVTKDVIMGCLFSQEYNGLDSIRYIFGNKISAKKLWGTNNEFNLIKNVKILDVPVYFCAGRYDYITPSGLVEEFYKQLDAPYKEFVWFEESAHFPNFKEMDKFYDVLMDVKERFYVEGM